jgi:hypothetical protein
MALLERQTADSGRAGMTEQGAPVALPMKVLLTAALIFVLALLSFSFLFGCEKTKKEQEEKAGQSNTQQSGYTVTVSEEGQKTGGIITMALKRGLYREQTAAYGEVLAPEGLSELYKSYISAVSGVEKAKARLTASEMEYARLKRLNENNKNISDKELQASVARLSADRAEEAAASGTLQTAKNTISLKWGPTIAGWVFRYESSFREVIERREVLVRITVPPSLALKRIPQRIRITTPTGASVSADFVSRATSTNPALQGLSFIYIAPKHNGDLVPGMNVTAQMPSAATQAGFFIPESAVVWLQGKAWIYVKKGETGFSRVEAPTTTPVNNGYFVSDSFAPGDRIVTKGAQALLSEESAPKTSGGGGEEEDED